MKRHLKALLHTALFITMPLWFVPALMVAALLFIPAMVYYMHPERKK